MTESILDILLKQEGLLKNKKQFMEAMGIFQRSQFELSENFSLQTPLEVKLNEHDHLSFEMLFNICCECGSTFFLYKVVMRNLDAMMSETDLYLNVINQFFCDDAESNNPVNFGAKLW